MPQRRYPEKGKFLVGKPGAVDARHGGGKEMSMTTAEYYRDRVSAIRHALRRDDFDPEALRKRVLDLHFTMEGVGKISEAKTRQINALLRAIRRKENS